MRSSSSSPSKPAFELKGSLFTLTVLHLLSANINIFSEQLRQHAQKTPNLFKNMPLVIDLQRLADLEHTVDFAVLQHHLREHGLIPVGVKYGNDTLNHAAQMAGLAVLSKQTNNKQTNKTPLTTGTSPKPSTSSTLLITKPVRSGQQVYARHANLVILAPVSYGAEVLADGSIHVYDSLRGRALAGINGDATARIFCHKLEAELISIAGHYRLSENLPQLEAPMTQVYLEGNKICIEALPAHTPIA